MNIFCTFSPYISKTQFATSLWSPTIHPHSDQNLKWIVVCPHPLRASVFEEENLYQPKIILFSKFQWFNSLLIVVLPQKVGLEYSAQLYLSLLRSDHFYGWILRIFDPQSVALQFNTRFVIEILARKNQDRFYQQVGWRQAR